MGGFDESVRVALRERAGGVVQVEELLAGARRRGVRRRRVRHALLGGATAMAVAAVVLVSGPVLGPPPAGELEAAEIRGVSKLPRPPVAGRHDSNLLRLDVADPEADRLEWTTDTDERQALRVGRARTWEASYSSEYLVLRGRSEADLDAMRGASLEQAAVAELVPVGGVTGTLELGGDPAAGARWASLRWKRPDGTWLGVYIHFATVAGAGPGNDRAAIRQAAQWVRVNVGYRCVADFRLSWTPSGMHPVGCRLGISPPDRFYGVVFSDGNQGSFLAHTEPMSGADVDRTIDKWLSGFMANGSERRYGDRLLLVGGPGLSREDVVRVVFGFVPMDDPIPDR